MLQHDNDNTDSKKSVGNDIKDAPIEHRVSYVEFEIRSLKQTVRSIEGAVSQLVDKFGSFKDDIIREIGSIKTTSATPKWGMIAIGTTILLTVLGLVGSLLTLTIREQSSEIHRNYNEVQSLQDKVDENTRMMTKIEATLDRQKD